MKIAILMTCFNRKDKTIACLNSIFQQLFTDSIFIDVFVVDDDSHDGTVLEIKKKYPNVRIIEGNGNLYWNGGMNRAWTEAAKFNYDFFLWVNDDVILLKHAIQNLINTYKQKASENNKVIVVGSTCDFNTLEVTYGGYCDNKYSKLVDLSDIPTECSTMNGNIVLIPMDVFKMIGYLDSKYKHSSGDMDYGLRAKNNNISLWVAPKFQGYCKKNGLANWSNPKIPLLQRYKHLNSPKGQPFCEVIYFSKTHKKNWVIEVSKLLFIVLFPNLYLKIKQKKY